MFGSVTALAALCTLLVRTVSAVPFAEMAADLPRDIAHIALDERTSEYVAFKRDGSFYGRYLANSVNLSRRDDSSSCGNLTVDEAKSLPGWTTIAQYADDNWGTGSRKIVTNPEDYLDRPAEVCISDATVEATFNGDPECQNNAVTTEGTLVGTSGWVSIAVSQGYTLSSTWTVSTAASIGVSRTSKIRVKFPDIANVSEHVTVDTKITNTETNSFKADYNGVSTVTLKVTAPEGETCNAVTSTTACTLEATAQVQYIATGWIWFNYDDKTNGHYKWAVNMDNVVGAETDRSSYADINGSVQSDTESSYKVGCS